MLSQERRDDHTNAIMHEARLPELTHACIDDRIASHPALPSFEVFLAIIPREARKLILKGSVWHRIKKINQLITKLSPADFGEKLINRAGPLGGGELSLLRRGPDLSWRDLSELKVRR